MSRRLAALAVAVAVAVSIAAASGAHARTYYGIVGPGATITLKNAAGKKVFRVPAGWHKVVVRDRSAAHNFHLVGYRVNRATTVAFVGKRIWSVRIFRGKTYVYKCDPHADHMRGSFRGV